MLRDPDRFLREKLSKRILSINTIRDAIMAAFLVTLQKSTDVGDDMARVERWRREKATEIREKASALFDAIAAPFEYPTPAQLGQVTEGIKKAYHWNQLPDREKEAFEAVCQSLFDKFEEDD